MIRTFRNLRHVDPGFTNAAEIQTVRVAIPDEQVKEQERLVRMKQAMPDKIPAINDVRSVSTVMPTLFFWMPIRTCSVATCLSVCLPPFGIRRLYGTG
jgi:hypothetical protein